MPERRPGKKIEEKRVFVDKSKMWKRTQNPLSDRQLTNPTSRVRTYLTLLKAKAAEHFGKELVTEKELVNFIGLQLLSFKKTRLPIKDLNYVYLQRTADEIIKSKTAYFSFPKDAMETIGADVSGCNDHVIALMGILRAMGKEPKFVREDNHTMVICRLNGTTHLINMDYKSVIGETYHDTKEVSRVRILPMNVRMKKRIQEKKEKNKYADGEGPREIGLMGISDYGKYWKPDVKARIKEKLK